MDLEGSVAYEGAVGDKVRVIESGGDGVIRSVEGGYMYSSLSSSSTSCSVAAIWTR